MLYFRVWVRSYRFHGSEPLTYSSDTKLQTGQIVEVELQKTLVLGVVSGPSTAPRFKTKPINKVLLDKPVPTALIRLCEWMIQYYPAPLGVITQQILPAKLSDKLLSDPPVISHKPEFDLTDLPSLTDEQTQALESVSKTQTYLLHGKTGSGKTRLYIELAARALGQGKSVIVLTPEISLTSQLSKNFQNTFGENVIVIHSKQTPLERQRAWLSCLLAKEPLVLIGPRSALFAPVSNLGLIVLDEEHESAYKQEQSPQYITGRVASYLAKLSRAILILGSATPLVTDYFLAKEKNSPILELKKLARAGEHPDPRIIMVDRKDHSLFNRSPYISQALIMEVEAALNRGEQSLLYLNRRGTARLIMCDNCGWQALCPHCDIPLTYHGDRHDMRCHSCSYHAPAPIGCPECGQPDVVFKTAGTKAIADEVKVIFPNARVGRFDTDNTKEESFEANYQDALDGEIDILVGTQMIAKGLDLPRLSVVGVLLADTSLYIPDFSAQERTYQLINQVIGRIGRGHNSGVAVIQTYDPDNKILNYAVHGNYAAFLEHELKTREQFMFPPYCYLLKLTARRTTIKSVETAAANLKSVIESGNYRVKVEGPAPAFHERFQGKFQWQLVVKSRIRSELIKIIEALPANWSYDLDPMDLL
jgi:primosomal protein N' (replication factor Y)